MGDEVKSSETLISPLRGEVAPQAREGVRNATLPVSAQPHPGLPTQSDPPAQGEGDAQPLRHVRQALPHDSGIKHVQGTAHYIDDIREPDGTLHVAIGQSPIARGRLLSLDLDAVRALPGVVAVLTAADIPGKNDVSPAFGDDPLFVERDISFHGQALFAVVATTATSRAGRRGWRGSRREAERPASRSSDALARGETVLPDYAFGRGDADAAIAGAPHRLDGTFRVGGQEHFYLEGQIALAIPGEDGDIIVHSSTQHPTEVQHVVARVLAIPDAYVTCETRRMGGGFGGKESQATQWAVDRGAGGAHARAVHASCGSTATTISCSPASATISAATGKSASTTRAGSADIASSISPAAAIRRICRGGVVDRAMFHSDNAYFLPAVHVARNG